MRHWLPIRPHTRNSEWPNRDPPLYYFLVSRGCEGLYNEDHDDDGVAVFLVFGQNHVGGGARASSGQGSKSDRVGGK